MLYTSACCQAFGCSNNIPLNYSWWSNVIFLTSTACLPVQPWPSITPSTTVHQWIFLPCEDPPWINFWDCNECHSLRLLFILRYFILQRFLHHVRMILALSKKVIAYYQWPLEKDTVKHVVHIQHIPKSICEVKEKKKKNSYMAWSL